MPGMIYNGQSGGMPLILSGGMGLGSGYRYVPQAGIQLALHREASGCLYVSFSGNVTGRSGGIPPSGISFTDGIPLSPGDKYFIPRGALSNSSGAAPNLFIGGDVACSGQARLYYEVM